MKNTLRYTPAELLAVLIVGLSFGLLYGLNF